MANKAAGKGYEKENNYENMKFHFFGIENIHVMRGSLQKLLEGMQMHHFILYESLLTNASSMFYSL